MRKLYKLWLFAFSFIFLSLTKTNAQTANTYVFSMGINASLDPMIGATTIVNASVDDAPSSLQTLPFNFVYEGTTYTEYSVSPDGFIKLGAPAASAQYFNNITSTTNIPKLFPFWDDLATGSGGYIRVVTTGTAPNRILKIEWFVTIPRNTSGPANSRFQAWLYETTNVIEFRYGTVGGNTSSASVGINGAIATNFISVTTPTHATSTVTANNSITEWPGTGILYRFEPPASACSGTPTAGTITATSTSFCAGGRDTLTLSGYTYPQSGISIQWQSATAIDGPYTNVTNGNNNVYITPVLTSTTYYRAVVTCANGGAFATTAPFTVTVNPIPTITINPSAPTICSGQGGVTLTASGASTYTWSPGTGLSATTGATVTATPTTTTTYTVTGTASNGCTNTQTVTVTVNPTPMPTITPTTPRVCPNGVVALSVGGATSPVTVNSGTISVNVPDGSTTGATHTLNVTGVPAGATITAIAVTINMTHTWDGDMIFNLKAPNNNVLNLINRVGGSGQNFVNTVISSAGVTPIASGTAPFTGTFAPSAANGVTASTGITSNVTNFSDLYSVPNGAWILSMRDAAAGDAGTLTNWQISISFTLPTTTWYPTLGLYTDAGATTPYTGGAAFTVYAKPSTTTTYVASSTAGGCTGTNSVTVLVDDNTAPTITPASASICLNNIQQLTAASTNTAASCNTNSGAITVNVPDNNTAGATHTINVSCVPAGAVITGVAVNFNMKHTWDGDMIINVKAPNGNVLNLVNRRGGSGNNFTGTYISSVAGLPNVSTGSAPFTNAYAPDGASGVGPTGYTSNVVNFTGLFSIPNGAWTLAMQDASAGDLGVLTSWGVTIYYRIRDSYTWSPLTGLYTNSGATTPYTGTNADTVYAKPLTTTTYTVTATSGAGCTTTANVPITVNQPPTITSQPQNAPTCLGSTVTFNVTATGTGLTYQWRKNGVNLSNGGNISGATTATLTISNVTNADVACYDVVITGLCNPSATSNQGCLTLGPPNISSQPQSVIACAGNTVTFSVTATGPGLTYQWRKNGVNLTNGGNISGATSPTLTVSNIGAGDAGNYDVVITNSCGQSITSAVAVLTFTTTARWVGTANSDWNNPTNWCANTVPTQTTDVQILAGTPFSPIVSVTAELRNLTIDAGATMTVAASGWLNIHGTNLTVNGTFNTSAGTLAFRNTANLNVPGMTVSNVVMNGAGGITLTGNMNITTALTLTNGNITLGNNNLTMTGGTIGSVASHIITNGTGVVTNNNVGTATVVFPIGPDAGSYNALEISNGQGFNYSARVAVGVPPNMANPNKAINRTWTITASGTPTADVGLRFSFTDAQGLTGYIPGGQMEAGYYNGTAWTITTPAGGTPASGSPTARQLFTYTRSFGQHAVSSFGGIFFPTGTPNIDADLYSVKLLPNIVNNESVLRVMSRRAMNVEWIVTDMQGRVVMKFNRPVLAGQNDINLKLGHLANGSYQITGYSDKGVTNVVKFVRM